MSLATSATASILALLTACASPPRFYETRLIGSEYDEANAATRVALSFEIWDADGLPIHDVQAGDLRVWEDGVLASSESTLDLDRTNHPIEVILLLDRSSSMRDEAAGPSVTAIARQLVDGLAGHPCRVELYSFANTVDELQRPEDLAMASSGDARSRWTALYYAVSTVLNERGLLQRPETSRSREGQAPESPSTVLVVCTDGADNYSHNHDLMTLLDLEQQIRANRVVIHALGLGNVDSEQDRQGISGAAALRRLAVNGSYRSVDSEGAVQGLVERVARYVRATYSCVYVSPSITGEHEIVLEVDRGGRRGRSQPIRFPTHGPR